MRKVRSLTVSAFGLALWVLLGGPSTAQAPPAPAEPVSAKTWIGKAAEYEDYLRTAEIVSMQDIGTGVTHPKRARLTPGGPFESFAFKPIAPGLYDGHQESYKAEIAAYEIDKLLELNMVPPTVERTIDKNAGAAIMWVKPTRSFKEMGGVPDAPPQHFASFNRQMVRAKMFDDLIGNLDPNLGNWLVDPAWNLVLIDHSRALTIRTMMPHALTRVDAELWDRMKALTAKSLTPALEPWLERAEIGAIIDRRNRMAKEIDKLVKARGEEAVFIR
jgi:hypothetical protein